MAKKVSDKGFALIEVLVALTVAGILLPAVLGMVVTSLRASSEVETRLQRAHLADAALTVALEVVTSPGPADVTAEVNARFDLDKGWSIETAIDPSGSPVLLYVTAIDSKGRSTEVVAVVP